MDVLARFSAAFHDLRGGSADYFEAGFSRIVMVLLGGRARRASVHLFFHLDGENCPYALARRNLANLAPTICLRKVRTFALVCVRVRKFVEVYMKWHEFAYVLLAQPSSFRMMSQQLIILDDRQKFSLECSSIY